MKKSLIVFAMTLVVIVLAAGALKVFYGKPTVSLVEKESYFSDFEVVGEAVYLRCYVTLKNTSSEEKRVSLTATSPDDVRGGLLITPDLYAINVDSCGGEFLIPPKTQKSFDIVFVGDFAGTKQKQDRLLPNIDITIVE